LKTDTITLPSGATAQLKTRVTYGGKLALEKIGARIGVRASGVNRIKGDGTAPQPGRSNGQAAAQVDLEFDPDTMAEMMIVQQHFPTVYMLAAWTCTDEDGAPLPLPTISDLSPLDELDPADGEALEAECDRRFNAKAGVDFSPTADPGETPFGSSNESAPTPEATA
jgi:hypothetical protein